MLVTEATGTPAAGAYRGGRSPHRRYNRAPAAVLGEAGLVKPQQNFGFSDLLALRRSRGFATPDNAKPDSARHQGFEIAPRRHRPTLAQLRITAEGAGSP